MKDGPKKVMGIRGFTRAIAIYVRPYRFGALILLLGLLVDAGFDTGFRYSIKYLIDVAIVPHRWHILLLILGILVVAAVLTAAITLACDYLWARIESRVFNSIRLHIYTHLQKLHMGFHSASRIGDIMARFSSDLQAVENGLISALPAGIIALGGICLSLALIVQMEWRLALLALAGLPLTVVVPKLMGNRAGEAGYQLQQEDAHLTTMVQEDLTAIPVIKAFGLQSYTMKGFSAQLNRLYQATVRASFLSYLLQRAPKVIIILVHLAVLAAGAVMTFRKMITLGDLVAFQAIFSGLSASVTSLTWVVPYMITAFAGMQRIQDILEEVPLVVDSSDAVELPRLHGEVRFENVGFHYSPGQPGLAGVNLSFPAGGHFAIVGTSGSGKSTLLSLLLRFHDPQQGRVLIDGIDIRSVSMSSLYRQMAIVFQESFLFNISVRENIRLGRLDATDSEVEEASVMAEIHDFICSLPEGYDTLAGERGARFSGGQRQRIALARALLRNPAILLLDEATSALDPMTEDAINRTIARIAGNRMVISVTHRLQSVIHADRLVVMEEGRVAEEGGHHELLEKGGRYSELWRKQSGLGLDASGSEAFITVDRIREFPLFGNLSDENLVLVKNSFNSEKYREGEIVFKIGDYSDKFYVIARGRVSVSIPGVDGVARRANVLQMGDCFGEIGLVKDAPRTATVETLAPCVFLTLSRGHFKNLLDTSPTLRGQVTVLAEEREKNKVFVLDRESTETGKTPAGEKPVQTGQTGEADAGT